MEIYDSPTAVTNNSDSSTYFTDICDSPTAVTEIINTIIDNWIAYIENFNEGRCLTQYLESIKDESDFNLIIETLNTCNCCERHQKNKPSKLEKYFETPFKNGGNKKYPCNCKCRQLSRFICRAQYGFCYKTN